MRLARRVVLVTVCLVLSVVLSCQCRVVHGQSSAAPTCTALLTDSTTNSNNYHQRTTYAPSNTLLLSSVTHTASTSLTAHSSFVFKYTVPNQRGLQQSSRLRFAVYLNSSSGMQRAALVAQSEIVTLQDGVSGRQSFVAEVQAGAQPLVPHAHYLLGTDTVHSTLLSYHNHRSSSHACMHLFLM